jgi:hypothetical protein
MHSNERMKPSLTLSGIALVLGLGLFACTSTVESPTSSGGSNTSSGSNNSSGSSGSEETGVSGSYSGSYTGDGNGAVSMNVASDRKIDVTANVNGTNHKGQGDVASDGSVTLGVGAGGDVVVTFTGKFANGKGSGTWRSSISTSGTWSVSK